MVCWSVVQYTHAGTHTHTRKYAHTRMLDPVTLALSSIYLFHYTSLGRTMLLCELWGICVCVCMRARVCVKEYRSVEWSRKNLLSQDKPLRWSSEKLMTHSHIHLCESLLFTCQPLCIQEELLVTEALFQSCITAYLPLSRKWHTAHLDEGCVSKIWTSAKMFWHNKWAENNVKCISKTFENLISPAN